MSAVGPQPFKPLTDPQRRALLALLADDDPEVFAVARARILADGAGVRDWLRPSTLSNDPVLRRRAQQILHELGAAEAHAEMMAFCRRPGEDLSLEESAWLLAATEYPEINADAYRALLDDWACQLAERLPASGDALPVLKTINDFLFTELRFRGSEDYYDPENSYLNRVIDRRTGNPISLCAIYLLVAQRLRLPIVGIGAPARFLCRHQSPRGEVYIDAFQGGSLMDRAECISLLARLGVPFSDGLLAPARSRQILQRMCTNLEHIYEGLEARDSMNRVRRYLGALRGG